jgi:BirA family biotin operon repressor/biotin-[acetyl-CoA-carboxylase] ligase
VVVRDPPHLLPLSAGVAVASVAGDEALIKWPNDVLLSGRKVAGILVEGRPQERWAVVGVGLNVAVAPGDFPPELRDRVGTLGLEPDDVEPTLERLLDRLRQWVPAEPTDVLAAIRARDALLDAPVRWSGGYGRGAGIDGDGRLIVVTAAGRVTLEAGEVHLGTGAGGQGPTGA